MAISTLGFGFQGGGSGGGGAQGPAGTNGSVWRNNDGVPSNSLGANGDYYLNNENGDVFLKVGGAYVPTANIKGADGTNGTNGSVWYAGNGVPAPSPSYNATDFFLDNNTGEVYQYSNSGTWIPQTNIFGTDGTDGSVWYSGAGSTPPAGTYNQNDLYLDTDTNELYQYDGANWNTITNIQGANGSQWYTGSGDPTTITNDGDFYLDNATGNIWEIVTGVWQDTGTNIKGANGTSGTDGSVWYSGVVYPPVGTFLPTDFFLNTTNGNVYQYDGSAWQFQLTIVGTGIAGSVWYNGSGAPSTLQTDGDYYLDNDNGDVYQQVSGSWGSPIANIKGAQGNNGTNGANSVNWLFNSNLVPSANYFGVSNFGASANSQTYININIDNSVGNQNGWLNAAKGLSDNNHIGYLQVTNQFDPTQYAVFTISSIVDNTSYFTFNVTFFGGVNYDFNQVLDTNFAFSYSFNGVDGSTWFNGNGAPTTTYNNGDYYLDNFTGDVYQQVGGSWGSPVANIKGVQGDAGADGVSSSFFFYRTDTTIISSNPPSQKLRWNDFNQTISTELGISTTTDDLVDITIFLALLNVGDTIIIQDRNDAANYQTWLVNGAITNNTTWFSVPVSFVSYGGNAPSGYFANNHPIIIAISREGAAGIDAANSQRYNFDSNVGGVPQAYSFTADNTTYLDSTQFRFDFFNQGQTDVTAWWDALYQNYLLNPTNNFLQIRTIANQENLGSYLIQQVQMDTTFALVKTNAVLSSNGALNGAVSVSYSLSAAEGGVGANGSNGANNVSWVFNDVLVSPPNERFGCSNPTELASLQTFFEFNINGVGGQNQSAWLEGAKDISNAGSLGYLQVTKDGDSINSAVYEINSVTQDLVNSTWTFNVSFYGGFDYNFNLYVTGAGFNFAYVFNGSTTGLNGVDAANTNRWTFDNAAVTPAAGFFLPSNVATTSDLVTYFQLSNTNSASSGAVNWLNGAKLLDTAGNLGYFSVAPIDNPSQQSIYTITSITDETTYFQFNVTFYGGNVFDFNTYTSLTDFAFSYVFNGTGGGSPLTIQDEGSTSFPDTTTINFVGAGVVAVQDGANIVKVTIAGGSGGDGGIVSSIRSLSTSTTLSPFVVGVLTMPYDGEITGWTIFSDVAGGCDVRYYVGTFAAYPPTTPLFTGLNPNPTLTAEISNDASGLSIAVTKGQVIQCELFAVSGSMARIDVTLQITKT